MTTHTSSISVPKESTGTTIAFHAMAASKTVFTIGFFHYVLPIGPAIRSLFAS